MKILVCNWYCELTDLQEAEEGQATCGLEHDAS